MDVIDCGRDLFFVLANGLEASLLLLLLFSFPVSRERERERESGKGSAERKGGGRRGKNSVWPNSIWIVWKAHTHTHLSSGYIHTALLNGKRGGEGEIKDVDVLCSIQTQTHTHTFLGISPMLVNPTTNSGMPNGRSVGIYRGGHPNRYTFKIGGYTELT